jgi:PTS system mannose-specific IIA component
MVGIVLVAHLGLAEEALRVLELIVGKCERAKGVSILPDEDVSSIKRKIEEAIKAVDTGDGVLIMTDMFGGTPSNIGLSYLEEGRREVICGFNLPMLIKLATMEEKKELKEVAKFIKEYGKRNIYLATEVLSEAK